MRGGDPRFGRKDYSLRADGIPDMRRLGQHLTVPVGMRWVEGRILWLNTRWWIERNHPIYLPAVCEELSRWLLAHYAARTVRAGEQSQALFHADRYGGNSGTHHGGSGRCAMFGAFNAKGIGPTPLIPHVSTGSHEDGRLSLVEAVREAVSAEIAALELPHGAVPVVAIIGLSQDAGGEAIVVRPNFVRPAHFLRSNFFGTSGFAGSDQHLDGLRVRAAVRTALVAPESISFPGVSDMMVRFGRQIGAGHANRLWQGRFLPSNVSVSGALVDFGSFRGLPSWHRYVGLPEEAFGVEPAGLQLMERSLTASFLRYGQTHGFVPRSAPLDHAIAEGFSEAVTTALGLRNGGRVSGASAAALRKYFDAQQREQYQIADAAVRGRLPWLYDLLRHPSLRENPEYRREIELIRELWSAWQAEDSSGRQTLAHRLAVWTRPRDSFSYEGSTKTLERYLASPDRLSDEMARRVALSIDSLLSSSLRNWAGLPPDCVPVGQVHQRGSSAVYCFDYRAERHLCCLTGPVVGDTHALFGQPVVPPPGATREGWCNIPCSGDAVRQGFAAKIAGQEVAVPAARLTYPFSRAA